MKKEIGFTTLLEFCGLKEESVNKEFGIELWKFQFTNVEEFQTFIKNNPEEGPLTIYAIDNEQNISIVAVSGDRLEAAAEFIMLFDHRISIEVNKNDSTRLFCKLLFDRTPRVVHLRKISDIEGTLHFNGEIDKRVVNEFEAFFCNSRYYVHFGKETEDSFHKEFTIKGPSGTLHDLEVLLSKLKNGELGKKLIFIRH